MTDHQADGIVSTFSQDLYDGSATLEVGPEAERLSEDARIVIEGPYGPGEYRIVGVHPSEFGTTYDLKRIEEPRP